MALAQKMGLKTVAWAQGIGPLLRSQTKWVARKTFAGCNQVSVRDAKSAELLTEWKVSHFLAPDPVWALQSKPTPGLWDLPAPRVAVTLRTHSQLTAPRLERLTRALVDFQKATQPVMLIGWEFIIKNV
ncbi:MAG: hypothetical protein HC785_14310 [Calothrix sp. CSU_2_0]|nr:hypothetical protein [Calothrix sp. CSU_2_0]